MVRIRIPVKKKEKELVVKLANYFYNSAVPLISGILFGIFSMNGHPFIGSLCLILAVIPLSHEVMFE